MQAVPPTPVSDFTYYDGANPIHGDLLAIFREVRIRTNGRPNELERKIASVNPASAPIEQIMEAMEAEKQLVEIVRDVFKMQPFNSQTGQGAREEHCWAVWDAFKSAVHESKKKTETLPISVSPTDSPPDSSQPASNTSASS